MTDSVLAGIRRHYARVVDVISYVGLGLVLYAGGSHAMNLTKQVLLAAPDAVNTACTHFRARNPRPVSPCRSPHALCHSR